MSAQSLPMPATQRKRPAKTITVTKEEFRESLPTAESLVDGAGKAIDAAQKYLLGLQNDDGYWCGELIVDVTLTSDAIIFMHYMGEVDFNKQSKCAKHITECQQADGGWAIYEGGPSELNATLKAYFALKLAGYQTELPEMRKAHATILRLGGIPKCNTYLKLLLALFGQFPWKYCPIIPPEIIRLKRWMPFNIYEMSSWSRAMVVPLSIINHFKPTRHLPPDKQLHELFPYGTEHQDFSMKWDDKLFTVKNFFLGCDAALKFLDSLPWKPFRARALQKAEAWILERIGEGSDGLAAIFPAMMYSVIAFKALGYTDEHPAMKKARKDMEDLQGFGEEEGDYRVQPCFSPVWDTAITSVSLVESGLAPDHPSLQKAAKWLLSKEVRHRGDWRHKNPHPVGSGWAFEYNNIWYPDVDDTFKVLMALHLIKMPETEGVVDDEGQPIPTQEQKKEVMERALNWAISFQCRNGGFAAFDKDVTKPWLEDVPFADHNAILDPPCSDITCRGLELFGRLGLDRNERFIRRAYRFVRREQGEDGAWEGRWGVNYIYGTWLVLRGLSTLGEDMNQDWIVRAREWLESSQNDDGGWGETCASYEDPKLKGVGDSTPSQTAWALMGIMACGDVTRTAVRRGIDYLVRTQGKDGSWPESLITGTGFPKVFYLKYDMYRTNWPLLALGDYRRMAQAATAQ